jgi:hypothetical protein
MLINALFDLEGSSLTEKKGKAYTCTVIRYAEYTANEDHPTSAMSHAEIRFHTADKLLDMIREKKTSWEALKNEKPGNRTYVSVPLEKNVDQNFTQHADGWWRVSLKVAVRYADEWMITLMNR